MTITANFLDFHARNPHVYKTLAFKAKIYRSRNPIAKLGIATLWENMRWDYLMSTDYQDFKLNNNYRSHYARLLMSQNPELSGMFETRERKAA